MKTPENLEPEAQKREILERLAVLDIEKQTLHKKLGSLSSPSIPPDTAEFMVIGGVTVAKSVGDLVEKESLSLAVLPVSF